MGCFSPFPHGTGSLSVRDEYLALRDGPRGFKQGFSCPALLRYLLRVWITFAYATVTLFGSPFQRTQLATRLVTLLLQALQPPNYRNNTGLGCSDFARHYSRNRGFFLLLEVRSGEHTSELQSLRHLVCRLLLEKKKAGHWAERADLSGRRAGSAPGAQ